VSPPEIEDPLKLKDGLALCSGRRIFLSESERSSTLIDLLRTQTMERDLFLAVGPEGGWTDTEEKLFDECGWASASLGPTILRAETAAIVATAIASQVQ
jgi:16S rRNA (uracil1498-N3)-methyltransferase